MLDHSYVLVPVAAGQHSEAGSSVAQYRLDLNLNPYLCT